MILASHILAGAVIATKINNPIIGLPLAFLSHFILDSLPHQEYLIKGLTEFGSKNFAKSAIKVLVDLSSGLGLIILGAPPQINFLYFTGAIFFSILPDFFQLLTLFNPYWLKKFNYWHCQVIHLKYLLLTKPSVDRLKIRRLADYWGWIFQIIFSTGLFVNLIWQ